MADAFYAVFSPDETPPLETHQRAMAEADRRAHENPGKTFYVMRSCSKPIATEPST